jgi:hypothetical protein
MRVGSKEGGVGPRKLDPGSLGSDPFRRLGRELAYFLEGKCANTPCMHNNIMAFGPYAALGIGGSFSKGVLLLLKWVWLTQVP